MSQLSGSHGESPNNTQLERSRYGICFCKHPETRVSQGNSHSALESAYQKILVHLNKIEVNPSPKDIKSESYTYPGPNHRKVARIIERGPS